MADDLTSPRSKDLAKWLADTPPVLAAFITSAGAQHFGADGFLAGYLGLMAGRVAAILSPATQRRLEPWLVGIHTESTAESPQEFWNRVEARKAAQEAVFVAADRLRSILDPVAANVLGRLTAEYVDANRFPDAFFRDFARLLTEVQEDELEELRSLCMTMAGLELSSESVRLRAGRKREGGEPDPDHVRRGTMETAPPET